MFSQEQLTQLIFNKLSSNRQLLQQQWLNPQGTNTRHFVLDDVLPEPACAQIYAAFPENGTGFYSQDSFREKKRTSANLSGHPEILGAITYAFQNQQIVDLIAEIVGFDQIESDPQLYAGGLSMMFKSDFLNPHIDNSHDVKRDRYRRLNLLYYATPDWTLNNGGNFELWNEARTVPKTLIALANRLIVMETNRSSWHSVSKVTVDRPRCCVSNYYFSKISPDNSDYFHVTSFSGRPQEKLKQVIGALDNALRNVASKALKIGRGKGLVNKLDK